MEDLNVEVNVREVNELIEEMKEIKNEIEELVESKQKLEEEIEEEIEELEETKEKIGELREIHGLSVSGTYQFTQLFLRNNIMR